MSLLKLLFIAGAAAGVAAGPIADPPLSQPTRRDAAARAARTAAPAPKITAPPVLPPHAIIKERDELVTIPLTSCYNYVVDHGANSCRCRNWDGMLPLTTVTEDGTSSVGCDAYSEVVTISTTENPYPYTVTFDNSAVIAYATTAQYPDGAWVGAGASTTIKTGKSITMELNPSASQNIGTLTGSALYTSISSVLSEGCGTVAAGSTMVTCDVPQVTGMNYIENGVKGVWYDGTLSIGIPFMSVTDNDVLQALISSVAGALMASSLIPNNTEFAYDRNMTNVASLVQAIYTDDTGDVHSPQSLGISLSVQGDNGRSYLCDASSLAGSGIYYAGFFAEALGVIPGFEWAEALGVLIEGAAAASDSTLQALALGCEITSLTA